MPMYKFGPMQDFQFQWQQINPTSDEEKKKKISSCFTLSSVPSLNIFFFFFRLYIRQALKTIECNLYKKHYVFHFENRFEIGFISICSLISLNIIICIQSFYRSCCFQKQKWSHWFNAFNVKCWALFPSFRKRPQHSFQVKRCGYTTHLQVLMISMKQN